MKYSLSLLFIFLLFQAAYAQGPITLGIAPDARSTGMGEVGLATSPDATSQHWNVAKYAFSDHSGGVELSYTPWLRNITTDMNLYYLSGYAVIGEQAVSASLRYFAMGDIIATNSSGLKTTQSANDFAFDLGYSRHFGQQFSLGLAFRYISTHYQERVADFVLTATDAFAVDLGAYLRLPAGKNEWTLGAAFSNIGTKVAMGPNQELFLPMIFGIGAQYALHFSKKNSLHFAMDINKPLVPQDDPTANVLDGMITSFNSFDDLAVSGGVEYNFADKLLLRGGYFYSNPDGANRSHATVGAGVQFFNFKLDCSYLITVGNTTDALKNTLRFTLGYTFGKKEKNKESTTSTN